MADDNEIQDWFKEDIPESETLIPRAIRETKRANAKKDTMDLVFVKIWAAMAILLAPLFASAARKNVELQHARPVKPNHTPTTDQDKAAGEPSQC